MALPILSEDTLPFAIDQSLRESGGRLHRSQIIRWLREHHPDRWEDRTIRTHLRSCSVNNPRAILRHPTFPRFIHDCGSGVYELYDEERHGTFDDRGFMEGQLQDPDEGVHEPSDDQAGGTEFAYEAHLRDYLAGNLRLLEPGLELWHESGDSPVEYQLEGRRIDILAKDKDGVPVVIELKLSKGHERTIGQALYYRAKLKQLLSVPKVRIILVAAEITNELRMASGEVADVGLFQYSLTMQLDKVEN